MDGGNRYRRSNLTHCLAQTSRVFPEADHVVSVQGDTSWVSTVVPRESLLVPPDIPDGVFRKSALLNAAVRSRPGYDGYVMVDADVYLSRPIVDYVIAHVPGPVLCYPFGDVMYLHGPDTRNLVSGLPLLPGTKNHGNNIERQTGLCMGFTREQFDAVNGFDEAFTGWGAEDDAFMFKLRRLYGRADRNHDVSACIYHMFHPAVGTDEYKKSDPAYMRNRVYCACVRRMSDADFAEYVAGRVDLDTLVEKYRALGRLQVALQWQCTPSTYLDVDTTIYDIPRDGKMTLGKVLDAIMVEDGQVGVDEFSNEVLRKIPDLTDEMKADIDARASK